MSNWKCNAGRLAEIAVALVALAATLSADPQAAWEQARTAASKGDCATAQSALASAATSADKAKAFSLAGVCYFRVKDFSIAIPLLERASKLNPADEATTIFLARAYSGAGRNDDAVRTLKDWMREHGEDPNVLYWTGNFYQALARQTFEAMKSKYPASYQVFEAEGEQFLDQQKYPQALDAFQKALAAAPANTPGLHFHLGDVYLRQLRYADAKRELEAELKLNPDHAQANYELGAIFAKEHDPGRAIPMLKKALVVNPALIEAYRSLGSAYLDHKNFPAALAALLHLEKAEPTDSTVHAMLASTYRQMGRKADATREAAQSERLARQASETVQANKAAEQKLGSHL